MSSSREDIEEWSQAALLLIDSAYLLADGFEPGENILFSLVIIAAAERLARAAEDI